MDEMPSAEFRKQYAKLDKPVAVTVNGHVIGWWMPVKLDGGNFAVEPYGDWNARPTGPVSTVQAQRDELLRKINRG
jgi:hypothetical protein